MICVTSARPRRVAAAIGAGFALAASVALLTASTVAAATSKPNPGVIVFVSNQLLYSVAPNGANLEQLTTTGAAQEPAISPDGRTIAYVVPNQGVWLMNIDGTNRRPLTRDASAPKAVLQPSWSPNGKQLVFAGGEWSLYVINADGTHLRQITDRFATYPAWSPDGAWIAFDSFEPEEEGSATGGGIYVVRPTGADVHRLTPPDGGSDSVSRLVERRQVAHCTAGSSRTGRRGTRTPSRSTGCGLTGRGSVS